MLRTHGSAAAVMPQSLIDTRGANRARRGQLLERSSGALATQASRPPWRRSTVAPQQFAGWRVNRSSGIGVEHHPRPDVELALQLRRRPAGVAAEDAQTAHHGRHLVGVDREVDRADAGAQLAPRLLVDVVGGRQGDQGVELHRPAAEHDVRAG